MQIKRFLGNIARTYLAIGALSVSAVAGANEFYGQPIIGSDWGFDPQYCNEAPQCNWGYNPPAYLNCGSAANQGFLDTLSGRADFLWWRASEEGLALGAEETLDAVTTSLLINRERIKKPNFRFDPGFRLGLCHHCPCDCWDIALNWTHFHTKAHATGETDFPGLEGTVTDFTVFVPFWERLRGQYPQFARSRWSLDLDLVDLELGYKYYVSSCFILRPHIGLRGARVDQKYRAFYNANADLALAIDLIVPGVDNYTSESEAKCDFLAVGPRIGLDAEVRFGCGFAIFGQAAGSIVFGRFDRHAKETHTDYSPLSLATPGPLSETLYFGHESALRTSRTITDLAIGIKWDHCYEWCNRYHPVSLAITWEHHAFYDMNEFNFVSNGLQIPTVAAPLGTDVGRGTGGHKRGNLFTQGLTVSLVVGF